MYLDRECNEKFIGTGERNQLGQDLNEFLKEYDPNKYQNPCNTVDTLVFAYSNGNTEKKVRKILLIKRANHPCIGWWALPGGFVDYRENIEDAAKRELMEETGIADIEVEQLKSYGDYDRDPRTRIITTAYVALVEEGKIKATAGDDAREAEWFDIIYTPVTMDIEETDKKVESKTENSMETNTGINTDIYKKSYKLELVNRENNVTISAVIEVTKSINKIFENKKYKVKSTNGLGADHGAIILEGLQYVEKALSRNK